MQEILDKLKIMNEDIKYDITKDYLDDAERANYWSAMLVVNGYNVHSDGTLTKRTKAFDKADPSTY